ncbi:hypothetical protein JOB18_037023 [Solea senegalensis]|uniref:Uncharacterized protein n=1 Tax=Solea senegalensis TaxID=28829 RepID=A0AAV6QWB0_SOLSE|nr:hypothetical protein JOB18_037023 [Solea senegalensis]
MTIGVFSGSVKVLDTALRVTLQPKCGHWSEAPLHADADCRTNHTGGAVAYLFYPTERYKPHTSLTSTNPISTSAQARSSSPPVDSCYQAFDRACVNEAEHKWSVVLGKTEAKRQRDIYISTVQQSSYVFSTQLRNKDKPLVKEDEGSIRCIATQVYVMGIVVSRRPNIPNDLRKDVKEF